MKEIKYDKYFWQDGLVRLRSMEEEDWEGYFYNRYDTPARRLVDCLVELPPTENEARGFVEMFKEFPESGRRLMFTVENLNGENVGAINLNSIDERNGTFSIGLQIDGDNRGKGYGTAAMRLIMKYAFLERRLNKYYGSVLEGNIGSATMMRKLGCFEEGVRRETFYTDGKYHDMILFGLTKREFIQSNK